MAAFCALISIASHRVMTARKLVVSTVIARNCSLITSAEYHNAAMPIYEGWIFIVATIYLQLIQNRYMFRSFTVLQCSHQHCVQPVASDVEVVGYL